MGGKGGVSGGGEGGGRGGDQGNMRTIERCADFSIKVCVLAALQHTATHCNTLQNTVPQKMWYQGMYVACACACVCAHSKVC